MVRGAQGGSAGNNSLRAPDLYWKELQQLKATCVCMRLYRNRLGRWVRGLEILRAVASSGAIGDGSHRRLDATQALT